jgi:hypothetical protein
VTGRALVFSDAQIIRLATEEFVTVAGDDWYERRRDDPEGVFFRKMSDQGPRRNTDGSTRQGIYCLTASGKLLAYKNHHDPEVMRDVLKKALADWKKLPASETKPGAVKIEDGDKVDARYSRSLPEGGLIVKVYTRILDTDGKDELCHGTCKFPGGHRAARDHLWLTKTEWESLIVKDAKKGDTMALPKAIARRIAMFHLVDGTRGEVASWTAKQVRRQEMTLTVEEVDGKRVRMRLDGSVLLATDENATKADRGYDARLLGYIEFDSDKKTLTRFEVVALGDHWGETPLTRGARAGRKPLGVAFELGTRAAADRVPPQAARDFNYYMGRGR